MVYILDNKCPMSFVTDLLDINCINFTQNSYKMQEITEELASYNILQGLHRTHKEVRHFCSHCTILQEKII